MPTLTASGRQSTPSCTAAKVTMPVAPLRTVLTASMSSQPRRSRKAAERSAASSRLSEALPGSRAQVRAITTPPIWLTAIVRPSPSPSSTVKT